MPLCWNVTGRVDASRAKTWSRWEARSGAVSARPGETPAMARRRGVRGDGRKFGARAHLVEVKGLAHGLYRRGGGPAGHRPLKLPGGQHRRAGRCARRAPRAPGHTRKHTIIIIVWPTSLSGR